MLKEFAEYLVSLKPNMTYEIGGQTWSDHQLSRVVPYVPRAETLPLTGLDSIVKLVRAEITRFPVLPVFVRVDGPRSVVVVSALSDDLKRDEFYKVYCDVPGFKDGFRKYDEAIIELRSRFAPGDDVDYLLDLLSRINKESGITTEDNGISQTVEARTGVSLKQMLTVRSRVALRPYRTFLEVEQPLSEFLLRLDNDGNVGLFEADGGMWKLQAKASILSYLSQSLDDEVKNGQVIVMM